MTDDEMTETIQKVTDDLNEAMAEVCNKNLGVPGGAQVCALAGVVARAIWMYSSEQTPAGRDNLLTAFIAAVEELLGTTGRKGAAKAMTDDEMADAAENAFNQIKPILTGLGCDIVGTVLIYLTANWLVSIQAEPPDPDATETARADALETLALQVVRLVRQDQNLRQNPQ